MRFTLVLVAVTASVLFRSHGRPGERIEVRVTARGEWIHAGDSLLIRATPEGIGPAWARGEAEFVVGDDRFPAWLSRELLMAGPGWTIRIPRPTGTLERLGAYEPFAGSIEKLEVIRLPRTEQGRVAGRSWAASATRAELQRWLDSGEPRSDRERALREVLDRLARLQAKDGTWTAEDQAATRAQTSLATLAFVSASSHAEGIAAPRKLALEAVQEPCGLEAHDGRTPCGLAHAAEVLALADGLFTMSPATKRRLAERLPWALDSVRNRTTDDRSSVARGWVGRALVLAEQRSGPQDRGRAWLTDELARGPRVVAPSGCGGLPAPVAYDAILPEWTTLDENVRDLLFRDLFGALPLDGERDDDEILARLVEIGRGASLWPKVLAVEWAWLAGCPWWDNAIEAIVVPIELPDDLDREDDVEELSLLALLLASESRFGDAGPR